MNFESSGSQQGTSEIFTCPFFLFFTLIISFYIDIIEIRKNYFNYYLNKAIVKYLIVSLLLCFNPFEGYIMEKKLSIAYCRKVLQKSVKENLTYEQVERIRDALYLIASIQVNHSKSRDSENPIN